MSDTITSEKQLPGEPDPTTAINTQDKEPTLLTILTTLTGIGAQVNEPDNKFTTRITGLKHSIEHAVSVANDTAIKVTGLDQKVCSLKSDFNKIKLDNIKLSAELSTLKDLFNQSIYSHGITVSKRQSYT